MFDVHNVITGLGFLPLKSHVKACASLVGMAAAVCCTTLKDPLPAAVNEQGRGGGAVLDASANLMHPILFLYGHLHDSIRTELDNLSNWVLALEADNERDLQQRLQHLKERYQFLEQVYKYHSSVEDEVNMSNGVCQPAWCSGDGTRPVLDVC